MATESQIDDLFKDADASTTPAPEAAAPDPKAPTDLAARVAAKRAKGKGAAGNASAPAPTAPPSESTGPQSAPLAATNGVSPNAKDELAKLASKRGKAGATAPAEGASPDATAEAPTADAVPDEIPGLTSTTDGGTAYDKVQADLAAARAKAGGKAKNQTPAQIEKARKAKEKEAAAKAKAKEKEKADKEKARAKEKTEKEKEKEAKKKAEAEAKKAAKAKADAERKAGIEKKKAETRARLEAARTPDLIGKENKSVQAAFAEDYRLSAPKTEKNPDGQGVRRAKADRGDFAAGWMMCLRRWRKQSKGGTAAAIS